MLFGLCWTTCCHIDRDKSNTYLTTETKTDFHFMGTLRCKISSLHVMSLSKVLDNYIRPVLYMYNISWYISFQNFRPLNYWYRHLPQKPVSVGPLSELMVRNIFAFSQSLGFLTSVIIPENVIINLKLSKSSCSLTQHFRSHTCLWNCPENERWHKK